MTIDNWRYSPFLRGYGETRCSWDSFAGCGERHRIPYPSSMIRIYKAFLDGAIPDMTIEIESMFDYMGHINRHNYPLDYWAIKLHDNWVRDQMYPMELYLDPLYDLVEVPIVNPMPRFKIEVPLPVGAYIAGGLAAWMAGFTSAYSDVDYFFTDKDALATMLRREYRVSDETGDYFLEKYGGKDIAALSPFGGTPDSWIQDRRRFKDVFHQLVLRLYKAPTEIVHGFDVDICGVLWDGTKLWATKRALYAAQNRINWFDPDRASPSYAYRLSKYMTRGIEIGLIGLDINRVLDDRVQALYQEILLVTQEPQGQPLSKLFYRMLRLRDQYVEDMYRSSSRQEYEELRQKSLHIDDIIKRLPRDPGSILILSGIYNFHTHVWKEHDYDFYEHNKGTDFILRSGPDIEEYLLKVEWKEQSPMEQVSSTRYPTPLEDMSEWWNNSPFIGPMV